MNKQAVLVCVVGALFVRLIFHSVLFGLAIGSHTTPSRQGFATFPSGAVDNAMIGFASFENGFKLADNGTSCSFDSLLPVSGTIDLIGGNLYLMESLEFSNTTRISTMGSIYGNGKTVKLASTITELRSTATDLMLTLSSYNMGTAVSSVDFSTSFSYAIGVAAYNVTDPELCLFFFDGSKLTVTQFVNYGTSRSGITCRWQPGYLNFVVGINSGSGAQLYSYSYNRSNGVFTNVSTLNLPSGQSINAVAPSRGGNYVLVGRDTAAGGNKTELFMYDMTSAGALTANLNQNLPGATRRPVAINAISWSPAGNYLVLGTAVAAGNPDLIIYHFNGTTLTATIQMTTGLVPRGVDWSPSGTFIAVAFQGTTTQNLQIFTHNISNGTLTSKTSSYINQTTDGLSVAWTADGNRLLFGAALAGGIGSFRQYSFDKTATTLSLINTFSFDGNVSSVRTLGSNDQYILGIGTYVYISSSGYTDGFTLTMDSLTLDISRDLILGTPLGIRNECTIMGNNHILDFDRTGTIIVLPNSSLCLKDITVKNCGGTQLRCFDNSATITLDNVRFIFKSPYYFNEGKIDIRGNCRISGTNPFVFASTGTITIGTKSSLIFDQLSTLSFIPASNNRRLIQFTDRSSTLAFNNASLYSTATGLLLTKGQLLIDGNFNLYSDAVSTAEAVQWGDGTSLQDLLVTLMPEAQVSLRSGFLVNRNTV